VYAVQHRAASNGPWLGVARVCFATQYNAGQRLRAGRASVFVVVAAPWWHTSRQKRSLDSSLSRGTRLSLRPSSSSAPPPAAAAAAARAQPHPHPNPSTEILEYCFGTPVCGCTDPLHLAVSAHGPTAPLAGLQAASAGMPGRGRHCIALHCRKEELRGLLTSVRDLRQQVGGKDDSANEANGESGLHKSVRPRPPLSHTRAHKRTRTYEVMARGVQARGVAAARTDLACCACA
jgi:hypothetical protein